MQKKLNEPNIEALVKRLNDPDELRRYKALHDDYKPSFLPRMLGYFLVLCGNVLYGYKPSYLKFRAVEVIARVPYHSWSSASYTHLTLFFTDEDRAIKYSQATRFADVAQANETMHVVVVSCLAQKEKKAGFIRFTLVPVLFSFFYFWTSYFLYLINARWSYELNYMFESHAFAQYDLFIKTHRNELEQKMIDSTFLEHYGRSHANQYEFFKAVRNDELIHRNMSVEAIQSL